MKLILENIVNQHYSAYQYPNDVDEMLGNLQLAAAYELSKNN